MKYLPITFLLASVVLVSIGAFLLNVPLGFFVTGILLAVLSYLVAPKGN